MTDESTDLAKAEQDAMVARIPPLPILDNTTVLVKKPEDLEPAFATLIAWANKQIEGLKVELALAQENLDQAAKMKVKTSGWKRQVKIWGGRVTYYEKIKSALEAGYFIMPDLPQAIDTFAVRTAQKSSAQRAHNTHPWGLSLKDVEASNLPEGEGRYVDPEVKSVDWSETDKNKETGLDEKHYFREATGLSDTLDFPMKAVRPQILAEFGKAKTAKLFDEIGLISPGSGRSMKGDPIVVGRITRKENGFVKGCSFIIHWWVDTKDL